MEALSIWTRKMVSWRVIPRWQYALYWRKDGLPLWKNDALVAKEGDTKLLFTMLKNLQLNLQTFRIDTKNLQPMRPYLLGFRRRQTTCKY
jgi:hypothetical protein